MLPEISPPVIVNVPLLSTYTPPPNEAELPKMAPPFIVNVLPEITDTPPPFRADVLSEIVPPDIVNAPP